MFIIGREIQIAGEHPLCFVDHGKEGIPIQYRMDPRHVDAISYGHGFSIDLAAADDEGFFAIGVGSQLKGRRQVLRFLHLVAPGVPGFIPGDYEIKSARKGFTCQGFECLSPHDDRHPPGSVLEKFHIVGQVPEKLVVFANGIVGAGSDDEADDHGPKFSLPGRAMGSPAGKK